MSLIDLLDVSSDEDIPHMVENEEELDDDYIIEQGLVSATGHHTVFPEIRCGQYPCVAMSRRGVVGYDYKTERLLKHELNWWSDTFITAYMQLLMHTGEFKHNPNVAVIFRLDPRHHWDPVRVSGEVEKIIILELQGQHYTLSVICTDEKTATIYDGYASRYKWKRRKQSKELDNQARKATIQLALEKANEDKYIGVISEYCISYQTYLPQLDGSACGPIAVMAFYYHYTGHHMFDLDIQDGYTHEYRRLLVDDYYFRLYAIESEGGLVLGFGRRRERRYYLPDNDNYMQNNDDTMPHYFGFRPHTTTPENTFANCITQLEEEEEEEEEEDEEEGVDEKEEEEEEEEEEDEGKEEGDINYEDNKEKEKQNLMREMTGTKSNPTKNTVAVRPPTATAAESVATQKGIIGNTSDRHKNKKERRRLIASVVGVHDSCNKRTKTTAQDTKTWAFTRSSARLKSSGLATVARSKATESIMATAKKPYNTKPGKKQQFGDYYQRSCINNRKASTRNHPQPIGNRTIKEVNRDGSKDHQAKGKYDHQRSCYCDSYCLECQLDKNAPCIKHRGIRCKGSCNRFVHYTCMGSSEEEIREVDEWRCIACTKLESSDKHWLGTKPSTMEGTIDRLRRLGIRCTDDPESISELDLKTNSLNANKVAINKYVNALKQLVGDDAFVQKILDSSPKAFPTMKPMKEEVKEKMAVYGRRFELQMLEIEIESCACCGIIKPNYANLWNQGAPTERFKRKHLVDKWNDAYHCSCTRFCQGNQFFLVTYEKQVKQYTNNHNRKITALTKVRLCQNCSADYNTAATATMELGRRFSARNGYGPIPTAVRGDAMFELHTLLDSFTAAEEAAIRMITPCISLVRLRYGNLGTKGNTTCLTQESKLNKIMPNLPSECKIINIQRFKMKDGVKVELKPYQFKKARILRGLEMLIGTKAAPWNEIQISTERLEQWPEEGNLAALSISIPENEVGDEDDISRRKVGEDRVADEGDHGPSPLQNSQEPDDTFDGTDQRIYGTNNLLNAKAAMQAFDDVVGYIKGDDGEVEVKGGEGVQVKIKGPKASFRGAEVLPLKEFVDMMKMKYAWARAFPTVFVPIYDEKTDTWNIPGDITGSGKGEKGVSRPDWGKWLLWRSDGRAARHPSLPLVLHNVLRRDQLHKQGAVCISLNQGTFEPDMRVVEIRDKLRSDKGAKRDIAAKVHHYAANVSGTDQYYNKLRRQFTATAFHSHYADGKPARLFHTGSMAEFHDPFLKLLLIKYVAAVEGESVASQMVDDKQKYVEKMYQYKTVVTHYFAFRTETWFNTFISNVYGVTDYMLNYEFAKSRGAIHFHSILYAGGGGLRTVG